MLLRNVFTGVLIAGFALVVNTSAADQSPPGDLVLPKLGGVDIQGEIVNSEKSLPVNIDDAEGLLIEGGFLDVAAKIVNNTGNVIVEDNLDIQGNLIASQLGSFVRASDLYSMASTQSNKGLVYCPSGSFVMSCEASFSELDGTSYSGPDVSYAGLFPLPPMNACSGSFYNESGRTLQFKITSVCFDPTRN